MGRDNADIVQMSQYFYEEWDKSWEVENISVLFKPQILRCCC